MYKETLQTILENEGLNADTVLYRYTNPHHISTDEAGKTMVKANADAPEIVVNHYEYGHLTLASEIGPGLAFALSKDSRFKSPTRKCIKVRLGDVLDQGGAVYQDQSSGEPNSWYLTMPKGGVAVEVVE
jgi:hypothetical protein